VIRVVPALQTTEARVRRLDRDLGQEWGPWYVNSGIWLWVTFGYSLRRFVFAQPSTKKASMETI
jgi:hypothetical protein